MQNLKVRKLADTSEGQRVRGYDPLTGAPTLINPDTQRPEPWPLLGVAVEGDPPAGTRVPMSWVQRGLAEGWIELENPRTVTRPAGPAHDPWAATGSAPTPHVFHHADALILKTPDGEDNIRYRITHQPDKYVDGNDDTAEVTPDVYAAGNTRVDWFYDLELEG